MTVLDDQALDILRRLRPGDRFTLRDGPGVFLCTQVLHPIEQPPYARAYRLEGPRGEEYKTQFRSPAISRIEAIVPTM